MIRILFLTRAQEKNVIPCDHASIYSGAEDAADDVDRWIEEDNRHQILIESYHEEADDDS